MHRIEFNARAVEALITEALLLQREARHIFAQAAPRPGSQQSFARLEAQAGARLAEAIGWLDRQRAHFAGEISLFRLRFAHKLAPDLLPASGVDLAALPEELRDLVEAIERFASRLRAIEQEWRRRERPVAGAIRRLLRR